MSWISADTFAFHVTYTCPLVCAHCCFSSSPSNSDKLDDTFVLDCIRNLPEEINLVAFTGGEPFLKGASLVKYVELAASRGFATRVVTSAYFGTSKSAALKRLRPLKMAGLTELSISWDDYHEEFVPFSRIVSTVEAAVDLDIRTAISSVQSDDCTLTADRIKQELGELLSSVRIVTESSLNLTGRAEEALASAALHSNSFVGPCPYVLTGPTMSAKGKLLACCGVIPETSSLIISDSPDPESIGAAIEKSMQDPLLRLLFLRGPYAIMEKMAEAFGIEAPARDSIGGNCEACKILFESEGFGERVRAYARSQSSRIDSELSILQSLGMLNAGSVYDLWKDDSVVRPAVG